MWNKWKWKNKINNIKLIDNKLYKKSSNRSNYKV